MVCSLEREKKMHFNGELTNGAGGQGIRFRDLLKFKIRCLKYSIPCISFK